MADEMKRQPAPTESSPPRSTTHDPPPVHASTQNINADGSSMLNGNHENTGGATTPQRQNRVPDPNIMNTPDTMDNGGSPLANDMDDHHRGYGHASDSNTDTQMETEGNVRRKRNQVDEQNILATSERRTRRGSRSDARDSSTVTEDGQSDEEVTTPSRRGRKRRRRG
jgi:hypothetical protein